MLDDDWQAKQNIVHTWAMLARNRSGVVAALEASFTDVVIDLANVALAGLNTGNWQLEMCRTCVEFLVQLSHDEEGKAAILEAKAIPTLAKMLLVQDEKTVVSTVNALMGITVAPEGKVPTVQVCCFLLLHDVETLRAAVQLRMRYRKRLSSYSNLGSCAM